MLALRLSALVACVAVVSACEQGPEGSPVPVNTADTTPPVILEVTTQGKEGGDIEVTPSSGSITGTLAADESMAVIVRAQDPEGVKAAEVWGTEEKTCTDPQSGIATRTGPGLVALPLIANTDSATTGGTARTIRSARQPVVMTDFTCPSGDELSLKLVFWGEAESFGGARTRSDLMTLSFTTP